MGLGAGIGGVTLHDGAVDVLNELQAKEKLATLLGKAGTFEVDGVSRDGIEESRKIWADLFDRTRRSACSHA